jgi:hypothetical protein
MKFLKTALFAGLLALIGFSSCTKEEIFLQDTDLQTIDPTETTTNGLMALTQPNGDGLDLGCISIDYPFSMVTLSGVEVAIEDEEAFLDAIEDMDDPLLDFVYPLNVTGEDGEMSTVNDADELADLFVDCVPGNGWGDEYPDWFIPAWNINLEDYCVQLAYPTTILDIDSTAIPIADDEELISYLADGNLYSFAFPLDLEDEDGVLVTIEIPYDLFDFLVDCTPNSGTGGFGLGSFGCYGLAYPLTLELVDGGTLEVNNIDEFSNAILNGEVVGFAFPVTLIPEVGTELVVNSQQELDDALLACNDIGGGFNLGEVICYDHVYPIQVENLDTGEIITINNAQEYEDFYMDPNNTSPWSYVFPLTLVNVETGEEVTVEDEEGFISAIEDCF